MHERLNLLWSRLNVFDYDVVIIGAGVGGHGIALHVVEKVMMSLAFKMFVVALRFRLEIAFACDVLASCPCGFWWNSMRLSV